MLHTKGVVNRRDCLRLAAGGLGLSMSGWLEALAADTASDPQRKRSCLVLWMSGGPSHGNLFGDIDGGLRVENLDRPGNVSADQAGERLALLHELQADFLASRPGTATRSHQSAYDRAARLMRESAARAFQLGEEKA